MDRINSDLLKKYVEGTATEEECRKVEEWLENEGNFFEGDLPSESSENTDEYTSTYSLSAMWRAFMHQTEAGVRYLRLWWWGTRIALPVLLLSVGIGFYIHKTDPIGFSTTEELLTLEVPKGQQSSLKLSDSTIVHLSGGSRLIYPKRFGKNERHITLEYGHAFLEVAKDTKRPFLLHSDKVQIKVLGTAFDVSNRIDAQHIAVVLKEGAVEFSDHLGLKHTMKPGDKLMYDKLDAQVGLFEQMDVSTTGQWTAGRLQFKQVHLGEVLGLLEDRYDVVFDVQDKTLNIVPVTGRFDNMSLERILFLLGESTGLSVEQQDKTIKIKR